MKYREACGEKVSALGFGTMRLPLLEDGSIDQKQVQKMTDYAMENGVNYGHNGKHAPKEVKTDIDKLLENLDKPQAGGPVAM